MAQSASNLTIGIGVDTSLLKVGLATATAEVRKFTSELNAAVKAGNAERQAAAQQNLQGAIRLRDQLTAVIKRQTAAVNESASAHHRETLSLRETILEISHLAHTAGIAIEGIKALRYGFLALAAAETVRALTAVSDRIYDITKQAREAGTSTRLIQTFTKAFEETGTKAEDAQPMIQGVFKALEETRKKMIEVGQAVEGTTILSSKSAFGQLGASTVEVLHGATKEAVNFSNVLKELHVDVQRLPAGEEGNLKYLQELLAGFENLVKRGQTARAEALSRALPGGGPLQTFLPALQKQVRDQEELVAKLQKSGQLITPEAQQRAKEYRTAVDELTGAVTGLGQQLALLVFPDLSKGITDSIEQVRTLIGWVRQAIDYFNGLLKSVDRATAGKEPSAYAPLPPATPSETGAGTIETGAGGASGGYVRGAGSGTSDSIAARLSNGEYVINAASTRRLGTGFLNSLNNFAMGGFVGAPALRFASGGLAGASTGGGTPVHLHLGGRVFATTASSNVASALVSEAHRQAITSAGVKPSWYAARPGGR